jgi:hypothetical protein
MDERRSIGRKRIGAALFACLFVLGGFITIAWAIAWAIVLFWGARALVTWLVG